MFSVLGHSDYDDREAAGQEGLLDVLQHAGLKVVWRDNNSGCKGACNRVETEGPAQLARAGHCRVGECFDEVLLEGLDEFLDHVDRHTVIVLHQKGSHGPAYYKRYPDSYRQFLPECDRSNLRDCTSQQVVNTYDNTILYTDHVLRTAIELLKRHEDDLNTALLYVSDHGESLGEHNLYLHGLPYAIAPPEQRRVPMILWMSPRFEAADGIDRRCLMQEREKPLSHDNLFHSVLGLMSVETAIYQRRLDLFAPCRDAQSLRES